MKKYQQNTNKNYHMCIISTLKKSSIKLFIRERISTSILTSKISVNHSIAGVLDKHLMDVLAFSCNYCRKLSDIRWSLSRWDIPNLVLDVPPKEEKILLNLSNINRKRKPLLIWQQRKHKLKCMNKFLIIHIKFDYRKFRAKMKSVPVLKSMYLGQLGLKI